MASCETQVLSLPLNEKIGFAFTLLQDILGDLDGEMESNDEKSERYERLEEMANHCQLSIDEFQVVDDLAAA